MIPIPPLVFSVIGALLTVLILTYILGDNPLYRIALHVFIGALVGYSFGVVLQEVFLQSVFIPFSAGERILVVPLILGLLLLLKGLPKYAYLGNYSVAYLIGVGTAVALSGALLGTLIPQIGATGRALSPASLSASPLGILDGVMVVVGTICTLMVFSFTRTKRRKGLLGLWGRAVGLLGKVGRVFLIIALAVAFAGALTTSLSIFIGRLQYLVNTFTDVYFTLMGF